MDPATLPQRWDLPNGRPIPAEAIPPTGAIKQANLDGQVLWCPTRLDMASTAKILVEELGFPKRDLAYCKADAKHWGVLVPAPWGHLLQKHRGRIQQYLSPDNYRPNMREPRSGPDVRYVAKLRSLVEAIPIDDDTKMAAYLQALGLGAVESELAAAYLRMARDPASTIDSCIPLHRIFDAEARAAAFPAVTFAESGWFPLPNQAAWDGSRTAMQEVA